MGAIRLVSLIAGALLIMASFSAFFTVNQTQQALVLQFGEPKRTIQEPGLAFKLPFIQDVIYYEKRVLSLIPQDAEEVILSDQKRLQVDAYARYQIEDPLLFYQTVRNELGARGRLEAIIDSSVRRALGRETLASILTGQRNDITRSIGEEVNASVSSLGIRIIDVRLRRADYPTATSQNIFNRMKSEREREANEFRATGEEEAQKIRADAEKTAGVPAAKRGQGLASEVALARHDAPACGSGQRASVSSSHVSFPGGLLPPTAKSRSSNTASRAFMRGTRSEGALVQAHERPASSRVSASTTAVASSIAPAKSSRPPKDASATWPRRGAAGIAHAVGSALQRVPSKDSTLVSASPPSDENPPATYMRSPCTAAPCCMRGSDNLYLRRAPHYFDFSSAASKRQSPSTPMAQLNLSFNVFGNSREISRSQRLHQATVMRGSM